ANQTGPTATGLAAGNYVVSVTDANSCEFSDSATVNEPTVLVIATDSTDVLCNGGSTGTATAIPSGATPGYAYQWNAAAGSQTTPTATGLIAGAYTVVVTDLNSCVDSAVATVVEPDSLASVDSITNVSCFSFLDGTVDVVMSGGALSYAYQWDVAAASQTTAMATGLIAGTYTLIVTDTNACQYFDTVVVTEPTEIITTTSTTDALCNGDSTGTATASVTGGVPGYLYQWDSAALNQTTATATALSMGPYQVVVTDTTGCKDSVIANVNEPTALAGTTSNVTNVSCFGFTDGDILISPSGGLPTYTYLWDAAAGGQTTALATALAAGTYTYTISDTNACTFVDSVTVTEPAVLTITMDSSDVLCFGGSTGTATAAPGGGTAPYAYFWDAAAGNQTTATATGLITGTYLVIVTDSNNCVDSALSGVGEPAILTIGTDSTSDAGCYGAFDGSISVSGTGGILPYAFLWDAAAASQITSTATGLAAGAYTVVLTDSNS
ncbi:MAG: SprB repeat-containing protein, partial [Flavobacteriales bacterium]|nr:SprB repeat-containing protein [Flavobacteriales bacterium]